MIIKVTPNKEKARSMLALAESKEAFANTIDIKLYPTNAAENYYDVIRELASAVLLLDGNKAMGEQAHKEIIDELSGYKEFSEDEIALADDLRIKRNNSSYEGKPVDKIYVENKKQKWIALIQKLKQMIKKNI
ncbi:MAG: hypothetical protein AABX27_04570 [Nanoarchaeota archaeon]